MEREHKTKDQLMDELRQRVSALEADRKQAELVALETKRYLTRLIDSSTDAIISTDKEGKVVLFNEGAQALLGYRADEVFGRRVSVLYGGEAGANEVAREMRKRGGTVLGFESALQAKDGRSIPVLISASILFDEEGQGVGTVGFAKDGSGPSGLLKTCESAGGQRRGFKGHTTNWKSGSKNAPPN